MPRSPRAQKRFKIALFEATELGLGSRCVVCVPVSFPLNRTSKNEVYLGALPEIHIINIETRAAQVISGQNEVYLGPVDAANNEIYPALADDSNRL